MNDTSDKQTTIQAFLGATGLPLGDFNFGPPYRGSDGIWRLTIQQDGEAARHIHPAKPQHYVHEIRSADPDLAAKIDAALAELKRVARPGAGAGGAVALPT